MMSLKFYSQNESTRGALLRLAWSRHLLACNGLWRRVDEHELPEVPAVSACPPDVKAGDPRAFMDTTDCGRAGQHAGAAQGSGGTEHGRAGQRRVEAEAGRRTEQGRAAGGEGVCDGELFLFL